MSYDRAIERLRRLDEIEAELKTIEKKLYWQRRGNHWRAVLARRYLSSPRSKTRYTERARQIVLVGGMMR